MNISIMERFLESTVCKCGGNIRLRFPSDSRFIVECQSCHMKSQFFVHGPNMQDDQIYSEFIKAVKILTSPPPQASVVDSQAVNVIQLSNGAILIAIDGVAGYVYENASGCFCLVPVSK